MSAITNTRTNTGYATIQAAIDAAAAGDTIAIAAGTYTEQLTITRGITLSGAGAGQTIIRAPDNAALVQSGGNWTNLKAQAVFAVVGIKTGNADQVTISNLTVDGADHGYLPDATHPDKSSYVFQGIAAYDSNLTVDHVAVTRVRELASDYGQTVPAGYGPADQPSGMNHNEAIFAESRAGAGEHTLTVSNSYVDKFQKTGILAWGPTLTVDIHHNTIQGYGQTLWSTGNAIQIASLGGALGERAGTRGAVTDNQILDIGVVIPPPGEPASYLNLGLSGPAGVLVYHAGSDFLIANNTITRNPAPSWHADVTSSDGGYSSAGVSVNGSENIQIINNSISGFDLGIGHAASGGQQPATITGNTLSHNVVDLGTGSTNDAVSLGAGPETLLLYGDAGHDLVSGFGAGDRLWVVEDAPGMVNGQVAGQPVIDFTGGSVSSGDGSAVAAHSVQVAVHGDRTTLSIDTDGIADAAEVQIDLAGAYAPDNFVLSGGTIGFANNTPVASAQAVAADTASARTITLGGADADHNALGFSIASLPAHGKLYQVNADGSRGAEINAAGTAVSHADGKVMYVGDTTGKHAGDFSFTAGDGFASSAAATVRVDVTSGASIALYAGGSATPQLFHTIQAAIDAASTGDRVVVPAGLYIEQLTITKGITLEGAGSGATVIQSPDAAHLAHSGGNWQNLKAQDVFAVIGVKSAAPVTITNLTVDGDDQGDFDAALYPDPYTYSFQGISVLDTDAVIDGVAVTRVRELASASGQTPPPGYLPVDQPGGDNHNEAIFAESRAGAGAHTLTVSNSYIDKFQKTAILAWGPTLTVDIHDNTIQGYGQTLWSTGNGIQIASTDRSALGGANGDRTGTTGVIANNQILDIGVVIPEPGQPGSYLNLGLLGPSGVLLYAAGDGVQITGNTITRAPYLSWHSSAISTDGGFANQGVDIYKSPNAVVENNVISGFDSGIVEEGELGSPGSSIVVRNNTLSDNGIDVWTSAGDDRISLGAGGQTVGFADSGNGHDLIQGFGEGDALRVLTFADGVVNGQLGGQPSVSFHGGSVTAGDGGAVAAHSVQVKLHDGRTTLSVDTDGVADAAELQVDLAGSYTVHNFALDGDLIRFVNTAPVALGQSQNLTEPVVITLAGSDADGNGLTFKVASLPASGTLFQLSDDGNSYGPAIGAPGTVVTNVAHKLLYIPQSLGNAAGNFSFQVNDGFTDSAPVLVNLNVLAPPPAPQQQSTVDGVTVSTETGMDAGTGLPVQTLVVPTVTAGRQEDTSTPHGSLADIPLGVETGGVKVGLNVGLPVGVGLSAQGATTLLDNAQALVDLIARIESKTTPASTTQTEMKDDGRSFLDSLAHDTRLITKTLVPTVTGSAKPAEPILVAGNTSADHTAIGLVIDARSLPSGTVLKLDNVDFAAVVGAATLRGGDGRNYVVGDDAAQNILLGADDDILQGGGGNDIIGSAGGNDLLDGGSGDDMLAGGIGYDSLAGGTGNDVLQGGRSDRGEWKFYLGANGAISAAHDLAAFDPGVSEKLAGSELDGHLADLRFLKADKGALEQLALLYHAAFGRAADIWGLNFWTGNASSAATVATWLAGSAEWKSLGLDQLDDSAFVQRMYSVALGRQGSSAEVKLWTDLLGGGAGHTGITRAELVNAFAQSAEHKAYWTTADGTPLARTTLASEQGWIAGSGDDRLDGGAGNNLLVGGDGIDTVVYGGKLGDYKIELTRDGQIQVEHKASGELDVLRGIELGEFAGVKVDLGFTQAAPQTLQQLGLLYQTALGRPADLGGLSMWLGTGFGAAGLARGFAESAEFTARYGKLGDAALVEQLFHNSGIDHPAQADLQQWTAYAASHSRADLLAAWINDPVVINSQFALHGLWLV